MAELKDKAISIKGKKYVLVSDRIIYFKDNFSNGSISTELVSEATSEHIIVKATILPDCANPQRIFTGYSQATVGDGMVNKTAALENAETSAVGRGLAMLGIGVIDSVASADEMAKAGAYKKNDESSDQQAQDKGLWCDYHKCKMFQTKNMKSPAHKHETRGWCNGKGYKDEIEDWKTKTKAEPRVNKQEINTEDIPF